MRAPPGLALLTCGLAVGGRYACEALWGVGDGWQRAIEVVTVIASGAVVASFTAGDPPRRPWILRAVAIGLVVGAHLVDPLQAGDGPRFAHAILIVANLVGAAAMLDFLRVVRMSGLAAPASGAARLILATVLASAGVTLALCVVGVAQGPLAVPAAQLRALTLAVSAAADAIVFVVAARLVQALLPMRDGYAAQPYLLLAIDGLFFLLIDVGHASGPSPAIAPLLPAVAAIGGAAGMTAALAQAWIVRRR